MNALLLLNGEIPLPALARRSAQSVDAVLCTDGGVRHARRLRLVPRFIIGDMDSLPRSLPRFKGVTYLCDFDEDVSDFEKALRFARGAGVTELYVAGALGGRLDHTLVNLRLISLYSSDIRIILVDRGLAQLVGPGDHVFRCGPGQLFTLAAESPKARITTQGLRYPLRARTLLAGSRGLSNPALSRRVRVKVHSGRVWIATA